MGSSRRRIHPAERLISGLRRKVEEEVGLTDFQIEKLLTVAEACYEEEEGQRLHKLDIIYRCSTAPKPEQFSTFDTAEVSPKGIH